MRLHTLVALLPALQAAAADHYDRQGSRVLKRHQHVQLRTRAQDDDYSISNVTELVLQDEQEEDEEHHLWKRSMGPSWTARPALKNGKHRTGVSAMQLTVVGKNRVLIIDKAENNPLQIKGTTPVDNGKTHPAWIQYMDYTTGKGYAMQAQTNTFCAGGSWLSNGSFVSIGGNPAINKASYYDENGITGIRVFDRCDGERCEIYEEPERIRLSSARWYPGACRLQDGSIFVLGGMTAGGFNNVEATDNPTLEYYPPKTLNNGMPIYSKFLHDALNSNLFPVIWLLPSGKLFIAANTRTMIYDWKRNREQRLHDVPNGVRITYPMSAAATLLPLTIANKWTPTAWFCGGSTVNDRTEAWNLNSHMPASKQCATLQLDSKGLKKGWQTEHMRLARIMGDAILTPDGKVVVVNGARSGVAGYGNVHDMVGQSNAAGPDYTGFIYDPVKPLGQRISYNMPKSKIARMYHSVATLTTTGDILITGSNPNADVSTATFATEYRVEVMSPPYQKKSKPTFRWCPKNILFTKSFKIIMEKFPSDTKLSDISVVLMDYGYHTHAVGVDVRLVELIVRSWDKKTNQVLIKSPMSGNYFPPGRAWLHLVIKGVPSEGCAVMIGDGADPPFSKAAYDNMMSKTARLHGKPVW